jgi:hypothetical protein
MGAEKVKKNDGDNTQQSFLAIWKIPQSSVMSTGLGWLGVKKV